MSFKPSDLRDLRDLRVLIVEDEYYSDLRDLRDLRVLILEGEYYLAADLAEALRDRGAQVLGPVATLKDAARALESHGIDRVVLDVNLRGEMSFPIADRLDKAGIPYSSRRAAATRPRPSGSATSRGSKSRSDLKPSQRCWRHDRKSRPS